jgi:uncharacterized protein (TIGR03000 family)
MTRPLYLRAALAAIYAIATLTLGTASPAAQARAAAERATAQLTITLPTADAELEIDGTAVPGDGASRTYETPPLQPGRTASYTLMAKWQPNTYTWMTRTKTVTLRPGERLAVDLSIDDPNDRVRVIYVPTPQDIAEQMVKLAGVSSSDIVFEPGCGDARITIAAVRAGAKRAICVDIDPDRVVESRARVKDAGLEDRIDVRLGDALDVKDMRDVTVVLLYMGDHFNLLIRPVLWRELKVGSRIVSHRFKMGDWDPERTVTVTSDEGGEYDLHRWIITDDVKRRR